MHCSKRRNSHISGNKLSKNSPQLLATATGDPNQDANFIVTSPKDDVPAIYLLGAQSPLQVEVRVAVCALSVKTALYTPLGTTSLEDSLCHSNNRLAGKHAIGGLRPWLDLAMAHRPWPSYPFWESRHLWLLKIEWGTGDKCNPGGHRVKGAHVTM